MQIRVCTEGGHGLAPPIRNIRLSDWQLLICLRSPDALKVFHFWILEIFTFSSFYHEHWGLHRRGYCLNLKSTLVFARVQSELVLLDRRVKIAALIAIVQWINCFSIVTGVLWVFAWNRCCRGPSCCLWLLPQPLFVLLTSSKQQSAHLSYYWQYRWKDYVHAVDCSEVVAVPSPVLLLLAVKSRV